MNVSVAQQQTIQLLEALVQVLEEKVEAFRALYIEH